MGCYGFPLLAMVFCYAKMFLTLATRAKKNVNQTENTDCELSKKEASDCQENTQDIEQNLRYSKNTSLEMKYKDSRNKSSIYIYI